MKISEVYGGDFLKAADLQGHTVQATISHTTLESFEEGQKVAVHFNGKSKALICNKTNSAMIVASFGDETDNWIGKVVELRSEKVSFQGKIVGALRVRVPAQPQPRPAADALAAAGQANQDFQAPPVTTQSEPFNDDVPW